MLTEYPRIPSFAAILCAISLTAAPASAQTDPSAGAGYAAEIQELDADIAAAETSLSAYEGGALAVIATLNLETLRLTRSLLEARQAAEESGAPVEITVPAVEPDPEMATNLEQEIEIQEGVVAAARREADGSGGLMQALALTRYETERLTLAQLRQALMRARYGIAFPAGAPQAEPTTLTANAAANSGDDPLDNAPTAGPDWADPDFPEIDYTEAVFETLHSQGFEMTGWWAVRHSLAEIDDTPQVFAINVSDWGSTYQMNNPYLAVGCMEQQPRVIFHTDDYLLTNHRSNSIPVTVRIGDKPARQMSWSKLTSNEGAGLFDGAAESFIRDLLSAEKVFLRLEERDGEQHDISIDLAGAEDVFAETARACQFSLIELTREDFRAIQTLLNAGGFDAGTPDGVWGNGSRRAMRAYQAANGLEETGAPDPETLEKMGLNLDG